jgi:hypothetical protein
MNSPFPLPRARKSLARLGALLAVAVVPACSDGPTTTRPHEPAGLKVISGASVQDSATAVLAQPLVVELRDSAGRVMAGVNVQFQASTATLNGFPTPSLYLSSTVPDQYANAVTATTDATGRVAVRVALGRAAGTAAVAISVPTLGYATVATFTVTPGALAQFAVAPADSAVYVGGSYTLRSSLLDRWGNPVSAQGVTYAVDVPGSAAVSAGGVVSGQAIGRARIVAQGPGGVTGVAFVSVVPQGTLLAGRSDGIYVFGLDGSGMRRVAAAPGARSPRWFPSGQQFVFSVGVQHAYVSDLNGLVRTLLTDPSSFAAELWAHPSRDGQWVYFGGYDLSFRGYPYRVHPDGTGLSLVPGFVPDDHNQSHPSASPTGDRVAYFREGVDTRDVSIRVLRMLNGTFSVFNVPGHSPEWSHADSIAFLDMQGNDSGPIKLMASDGSGQRYVGSPLAHYDFGIDWSPDDKWIVAREVFAQRLELIEVATGRVIPLPYSSSLSTPAWKP